MREKLKQATEYLKYTRWGALFVPLAVYILLLLSNLINTFALNRGNALIIVFLALSLGLPALLWIFIREKKRYIPSLKINVPKKEHIIPLLLSFIVLASGCVLLDMLFSGQNYVDYSMYNTFFVARDRGFFGTLYTILVFAIIPAALEELIFRGILCAEFERRGTLCATLPSSLFFSFTQFSFSKLPIYFFIGLVLAMMLYATRSIICTVALHIAYKIFAIFAQPVLVSIKDVSASPELFVFLVLIALVVSLILLALQLSKLYKAYSDEGAPREGARSIPLNRTAYSMLEGLLSPLSLCSLALFLIAAIIFLI